MGDGGWGMGDGGCGMRDAGCGMGDAGWREAVDGDDERTLTELPRKLNHNAQEAKRVADSLRGLRSHCDHGPGRADRTRAAPRTVEQ